MRPMKMVPTIVLLLLPLVVVLLLVSTPPTTMRKQRQQQRWRQQEQRQQPQPQKRFGYRSWEIGNEGRDIRTNSFNGTYCCPSLVQRTVMTMAVTV